MHSGMLILLLSVVTMIYRYAEILSVSVTKSVALSLVLKRLSIFFAILIGGKLFGEHRLGRKIIATIILIMGVLFILL
jgi:drug/metabolite transporter (DMT)-like permease